MPKQEHKGEEMDNLVEFVHINSYNTDQKKKKTITKPLDTGNAYFIRFSNMDLLVRPSGL